MKHLDKPGRRLVGGGPIRNDHDNPPAVTPSGLHALNFREDQCAVCSTEAKGV
jgi:hypothetical protein